MKNRVAQLNRYKLKWKTITSELVARLDKKAARNNHMQIGNAKTRVVD